jgi:BNR/Asp-box repeat
MRKHRAAVMALAFAVVGFATVGVARADEALPRPITQFKFNPATAPSANTGKGSLSLGNLLTTSGYVCGPAAGAGSDPTNVNTDCDGLASPHNETSIGVNPTDTNNIIGGANDYQLITTNGGTVKETVDSRAHVSFDGGKTWSEYAVRFREYNATGDPGIAFDADGRAYYSTLGFRFPQGKSPTEINADILVAHSTDEGRTWSIPSRVAQGTGSFFSTSTASLDKPYITAWGHGNAIVTYSNFTQGPKGSYISSPIYDSVTHDGGVTWSKPQEISGSAPFCIGDATGGRPNACAEDQFSTPVFSGGRLFVSFESTADPTTGNDQYLVVEVDPATGARTAGPFKVANLVDGSTAYPISAEGNQTYQDSQFRTNSAGDITADPTDPNHLAVIWSDMRNGPVLTPGASPYDVTTNSDVVVSQSFDAGRTWSTPTALALPNDQFQPWGAYDSTGHLRIGYFDRSVDGANHLYGYSLATETTAGALTFASTELTTVDSQPTMNDRWFSGITVDPDFPHPTQFLGDYSNIATDYNGGVVAYWTDMRNTVTFGGSSGFGEDAFFAHAG